MQYTLQEKKNTNTIGNSRTRVNQDPQVAQEAAEADPRLHLAEVLRQEPEHQEVQFPMEELDQTQDKITEETKKIVSLLEDVFKNSIVG